MQNRVRNDIQNLLSGKGEVRFGAIVRAITDHLGKSPSTGAATKEAKHLKKQETEKLVKYISENSLWIDVDFRFYVSEGAEQKVYLKDSAHVIKLNDAIYYESWRDYFISLLLHNYFFPDTAYQLLGFTKHDDVLYAVVKQSFVAITEPTDLAIVKAFLQHNGFVNTRNNDYFNEDLGIILEDLHDENVLTRNGVLYFIDTVFYLTKTSDYIQDN